MEPSGILRGVRVGLVVYGSLDVVSGGNVYDRRLVEHLRSGGHTVEVLSLPHRRYGVAMFQNWALRFRRRLGRSDYDLLLQDELVHPSLFWLNQVVRPRVSYPFVSIVHHLRASEERPDWQNDFYRRVESSYLSSVDAFVFNSQTTRESVEELLSRKTENVVATPGGDRAGVTISPPEIAERARRHGALGLLFVGNLIPRKGLHDLLEALSSLREREWHLNVVGSLDMDRDYVARIERQIARLELDSRLTLHGTLTGERLNELFRKSQLFVLPSSYEGFGIVFLEAMSFGLPVIAGAAGATDEIVLHESTGFLVQPSDHVSLGRRLEQLMQNRELLARMSVAAYERFRAHPTWEASMKTIESFLTSLAGHAKR